jgi:hypothetical protein
MLTTTRVSVGIAFGPGNISPLGDVVATAFVGSGEGAEGAEGAGVALVRGAFWLFGSTVQPNRNTNKKTISRDRFILLAPFRCMGATGVPVYLLEEMRGFAGFLHD